MDNGSLIVRGSGTTRRVYRDRDVRKIYRDRSKYTGAMLREIRAERGCGRPPKVLAARRAKALAALRVDDVTRPE